MSQTGAVTLSIRIPTYNWVRYLDNPFGELATQISGLRHSYELLVGDNCSGDTAEQVVTKYQDKLSTRYFRCPPNLGSAENLNQLYRSAQGKYVLYYADDDLLILVKVDKNFETFECNAVVGVIFAPWFIHDLPTRQDIMPFYRQDDNYLIKQHDYVRLLALTLSRHIFPEIYLARRGVPDRSYFAAPEHAFWAFTHAAEIPGSYTLRFSKTPFYRSVARYFDDGAHTQVGNEGVGYAWNRYHDGLEYVLSKFVPTSVPDERQEWPGAINQFVLARMKVALRLRTQEGGHWIGNYYIANRIKALGGVGDLSAPYGPYRVNAVLEYITKLGPFKPEPPRYITLRRVPFQILYHAYGLADTEFMVLDNNAAIPRHIVIVTPIPMDIAVSVGREIRLVSKPGTFAKFP